MKSLRTVPALLALAVLGIGSTGCTIGAVGRHAPDPEERPEQVMNAAVLYKENCAACHGDNGRRGVAIALANPVYLAIAGADNLRTVTAKGVSGTMMPAFSEKYGGSLTDQQIDALVKGMLHDWARAGQLHGVAIPAYATAASGDATRGKAVFATYCARCHGDNGTGFVGKPPADLREVPVRGSIVDTAFLALMSDQGLRSLIVAGQPDYGMPDWRGEATGPNAKAMTETDISDVVAWLASHRVNAPGQIYAQPLLSPGEQNSSHSGEKP